MTEKVVQSNRVAAVQRFDLFINGKWVKPRSGNYLPDYNPWTGELFAEVADADEADVDDAVQACASAQKQWKTWQPSRKEKVLLNAADILETNKEDYIRFLCEESGSALQKARHEVGFVINVLRTAAGECRRIIGEMYPSDTVGLVSMVVRKPRGVIAAIGPFNYPFLLLVKKVAFGIAAGNGLVIKSSSETPAIVFKIASLFAEAGVPDGLVNAISGRGSTIGDAMVIHPLVNMVAFTGSTSIGRHIGQLAAGQFKKATLELGGKSPMIIMGDADLEFAVNAAAFGIFDHQGQICMVNSRIFVERLIYDEFVQRLKKKAEGLSIGNEVEREIVIGPLINSKQWSKVDEHVNDAISKGATLVTGGPGEGLFYQPTIITNMTPKMKAYAEETFGPVAIVIPFDEVEEAINHANASEYGLSSSVITNNISLAFKIANELEAGAVHINDSAVYDEPMTPHGGVKNSGMGREGGHYSIDEYTELKWITVCTEVKKFPF
jgi:acyl-CoA reductase-like NAD-dependent aldehyde dehydrogenase